MIEAPKDEDIQVQTCFFDYSTVFAAEAKHATSGPIFRHGARVQLAGCDERGKWWSLSKEEADSAKKLCIDMARAGVLKKIHAHLAIINPIDND